MNEIFIIAGAAALAAGYAISDIMLRKSTVEELHILLATDSTEKILAGEWGFEEFPEFFMMEWRASTRESYRKLLHHVRRAEYGKSRRLLVSLIKIEDERQESKGKKTSDERFIKRTGAIIAKYKHSEDFSGFLAAFIEKRHMEMI